MATILATWREPGEVAVETAWKAYQKGSDLLTSLVKGLGACEEDDTFLLVGRGSLPNSDGALELDAAVMDGADLSAGAVCAVQGICPVIELAQLVKDRTPHIMLAGDQARRFAIEQGLQPRNLMTSANCEKYEEWVRSPENAERFLHTLNHHGDTVTMLGHEDSSHVVSACSTSGLAWKQPGRVGDSPIIGAGLYADDEVGCAGATGMGEELWRTCAAFRTCENMRRGMTAQEACEATVQQMLRRQPAAVSTPCVVFAMGNDGNYGAATTYGEFQLWICKNGDISMREYSALVPAGV